MVRLASNRRSANASSATRRWKMRLSQYSTCAKNNRCWHPASLRSLSLKNGVKAVSHFWPQVNRSCGVSESANSWRRWGLPHFKKILEAAEIDTLLAQAIGQPMMLIEADT